MQHRLQTQQSQPLESTIGNNEMIRNTDGDKRNKDTKEDDDCHVGDSYYREESLHHQETPNKHNSNIEDRRGYQVQMVFAMQGLGIWFNSIVLLLLLWITGQTGKNENQNDIYDHNILIVIWNICYLIGALILVFVLLTRIIYLNESKVWADDKQRRHQQCNDVDDDPDARGNSIGTGDADADAKDRQERSTMAAANMLNIPSVNTSSSSISSLSNPTLPAYQYPHDNIDPNMYYDDGILKPVPSTEPDEDLQSTPYSLLFRNFGIRLVGASSSWLLWDISFYGNKLFQSSFLLALTGDQTTLLQFMVAAFVNATVSLLGYYGAAILIDNPKYGGRLQLQAGGFLITGILFLICGFTFDRLSNGMLVLLYLLSGFFGQLGPNATTFIIPAEIFPTEMRTFCHGICAASGKVGALLAAIIFNQIQNDANLFLVSGYASFVGCIVTIWTIPDVSNLNILEIDRKWRMTLEGRKGDYVGEANHPNNLSMFERWKLGLPY